METLVAFVNLLNMCAARAVCRETYTYGSEVALSQRIGQPERGGREGEKERRSKKRTLAFC